MNSVFDQEESARLVERVRALQPSARAQWGRMDVAQMLTHLQAPIRLALGDVSYPRAFIGRLFGGLARRTLTGPRPFGKNMPTDPRFVVRDAHDFAAEQAQVVELVERLAAAGPGGLARAPHPFFGPLDAAQWDALMWKHLDHHLRQFGA